MKVILHFQNIADMKADGKTFFVKLNDVEQHVIQDAKDEYQPDVHGDSLDDYINDIYWQRHRIQRLGFAQASMMSASTRTPYVFSGYELPERIVKENMFTDKDVPYFCAYPVWDWPSLVSDDYLKQ